MAVMKKFKTKRVALVRVTREFIATVMFRPTPKKNFVHWAYEGCPKKKHFVFPKDLKLIGMEYRAYLDCFEIVLESPDFKPLAEGEVVPKINFCFESKYEKVALQ